MNIKEYLKISKFNSMLFFRILKLKSFGYTILVLFIYQFIVLTIDYTEFDHNIKFDLQHIRYIPSFTLCLDRNYLKKVSNFKRNYFKNLFICYYRDIDHDKYYIKPNYYLSLKSNITKNDLCFTLFNDFEELSTHFISRYRDLYLLAKLDLKKFSIKIHHYYKPAFFDQTEEILIKSQQRVKIDVNIIRHELLELPYSTDCIDYTSR